MKAEHRKELQTNVLADRLGRLLEGVKEGPSRSTWLILGAVALVVVLILAWRYFAQSAESISAARWVRLDGLATGDELEDFINDKDNKGTPQLRAARFELARLSLAEGLAGLGKPLSRPTAVGQIKKAAETYEQLADETGELPLLHEEALSGAARAYESLGEFTKAKTFYERLVKEHGKSPLARDANAALERLNDEKNAADLKALADLAQAKAPPAPSLPPSPAPGPPTP
jgi:tetratricopeptide (TPR) repeat protein